MSESSYHIIEKITIEINANSVNQAHQIEKDIQHFIKVKIIPEIERFFETVNQPILHFQLDKISLNFDKSILSNPFWKVDLQKQLQKEFNGLISALEKAALHESKNTIENKSTSNDLAQNNVEIQKTKKLSPQKEFSLNDLVLNKVKIRNIEKSDLQALSYFLINGNAPWWINSITQEMRQILEEKQMLQMLNRKDVIIMISKLLNEQPTARKRWVYQFNNNLQLAIYWKLIESYYSPSSSTKKIVEAIISSPVFTSISRQVRHQIWFALLTLTSDVQKYQDPLRKKEFIQYLVLPFLQRKTHKNIAALNKLIDSIIKQSDLSFATEGFPPILSLAALFVVELPDDKIQRTKAILAQVSTSEFEIIEAPITEFSWTTAQLKRTIITDENTLNQKESNVYDIFSSKKTLSDSFLFFSSLYLNGSKLCLKHHYCWYFMSESSHHIIEKVAIEIDVGSLEQAHQIEKDVQTFIKEKIIPEIERFFEVIDKPDLHLQMDSISLNFDKSILSSPFWKTDLQKQLQKEFQEPISALEKASKNESNPSDFTSENVEIRTIEKSDLQALSHFLVTGNAPWWMNTATQGMHELLKEKSMLELLERTDVIELINRLFKEQPTTRKRWVLQFSDTLQLAVYWKKSQQVHTPSSSTKIMLEEFISSPMFAAISKQDRHEIWFALHTLASSPAKFQSAARKKEFIQHIVLRFSQGKTVKSTAILDQIIGSIVAKSTLSIPLGELPPILYFATLLVVEIPQAEHQTAKTTLNKNARPEFEIIEHQDFKFEWIAPNISNTYKLSEETTAETIRKELEQAPDTTLETDPTDATEVTKEDLKSDVVPELKSDLKSEAASESINEQNDDQALQVTDKKSDFEETLEEDWNQTKQPKDLGKGVFVENAGILLMHPFLAPLLKNLGYIKNAKQLTEPLKAAQIVHFMATGQLECFEHEMQFAKFLCGLSSGEVMDKSMILTDEEKKEVEKVQLSALSYWKSIKSSSIPLLQNEFLKRPGKLFIDGDVKRIVVEKKTVDILMNDLPWSIGLVQLPWLKDLIHVEWN